MNRSADDDQQILEQNPQEVSTSFSELGEGNNLDCGSPLPVIAVVHDERSPKSFLDVDIRLLRVDLIARDNAMQYTGTCTEHGTVCNAIRFAVPCETLPRS